MNKNYVFLKKFVNRTYLEKFRFQKVFQEKTGFQKIFSRKLMPIPDNKATQKVPSENNRTH